MKHTKMGSSGKIAQGMQVKIVDEDSNELPKGEKGEIIVKGENVMLGYWRNEKATKETLRDGWLYTGDLGYIDSDGYLFVLGRSKSLLISDDGEKFSPEGIEEAFTEKSEFIQQCILYNNQKPYSVCLLVLNREVCKKYLAAVPSLNDDQKLTGLMNKIEDEINKFRKGGEYEDLFPHRWLPASIGILEEEFTEENRLMNSTLKIVRPKITRKYSELIDFLYTPEAKNIANQRNLKAIKQFIPFK